MFFINYSDQCLNGRLIYDCEDLSFDTHDRKKSAFCSILINYINIDVSADGDVFSVWGVSPYYTWKDGRVIKPKSQKGKIRLLDECVPGTSIRVMQSHNIWSVTYDSLSGWLRIGEDVNRSVQCVEFLAGCVLGVAEGEIYSLWLRPEFLHQKSTF